MIQSIIDNASHPGVPVTTASTCPHLVRRCAVGRLIRFVTALPDSLDHYCNIAYRTFYFASTNLIEKDQR